MGVTPDRAAGRGTAKENQPAHKRKEASAMWSTLNAFQELEALSRHLNHMFSVDEHQAPAARRTSFLPGFSARSYPMINLDEDANNIYVEALAPGVDPKALELTAVDRQLRISGEKTASDAEIPAERIHRNERGAGKFIRTLTLPREVDSKKIQAEYRNGILSITLPKAAEAKPRQIAVKVK